MKPYYEDGASGITIYHGDALEVLPLGPCNALVADPPFAMAGGLSNGRTSIADTQFFSRWWRDVCEVAVQSLTEEAEGFLWCDWRTAAIFAEGFGRVDQVKPFRVAQMVYHQREMPGMGQPFRSSVDMMAYVRGPKATGRRIPNTTLNWLSIYWYYGKHEFHPAEKSPKVAEQLVAWCSDPGDLVLDPFMGSGTTLIAAKNSGRRAIGIDLEERYCEIAAQRLMQSVLDFGGAA